MLCVVRRLALYVNVRRLCAAAMAVGLLLGFVPAARAAFDLNDTTWEGGSELFELAKKKLGRDRLEIAATLDYSKLSPKDGVVILHPEVPLDYAELSAFLRAGGRLALLDDHGSGDKFLARFQIYRVRAPSTPAKMLRDNPNLAIAEPAVQIVAGQEQNRHPITQNVDSVVTNHPTALTHPNLTPVLTIAARGEPDATLAVTGIIVNRGRLFAMGDPSAFINLMLRYPGNRKFAEGLLTYLVEPDSWGERGGKLYFVTNHFSAEGSVRRSRQLVVGARADHGRRARRRSRARFARTVTAAVGGDRLLVDHGVGAVVCGATPAAEPPCATRRRSRWWAQGGVSGR